MMFAVLSLQDHPWPILVISLVMVFAQLVDRFNDRAVRPIPAAGSKMVIETSSARDPSQLPRYS